MKEDEIGHLEQLLFRLLISSLKCLSATLTSSVKSLLGVNLCAMCVQCDLMEERE